MSDLSDLEKRVAKLEAIILTPGISLTEATDSPATTPKDILVAWDAAHLYIRHTPYLRTNGSAEATQAKRLTKQGPDEDRRKALMYVALTDPFFEEKNLGFLQFCQQINRWDRELVKAEGSVPDVITRSNKPRDRLKAAVKLRMKEREHGKPGSSRGSDNHDQGINPGARSLRLGD